MKKFLSLLLLSVCFIPHYNANALETTITYNKLQGIAYNQKINGQLKSNIVTMFQLQDRIAYCIEPGIEINEKYYDIGTDWSKVNFSDDLKNYIEKVGYYGYEYPGHKSNYYYIAAQELIWKAVKPDIEVTWTTGKNLTGNIIDVSKEKNEILNLVKNHDLKPSFSEKEVKDEVGKTIVLQDENEVLDDYEISDSKYHDIEKKDNKLTITLNNEKVLDETLKLVRKHYDNSPLLIYSKGNSQKLAALRITTDKETYIKISNEEISEVVEVPNTGFYNISGLIGTLLVGVGLVLFKRH